jgi:hypothetical protein
MNVDIRITPYMQVALLTYFFAARNLNLLSLLLKITIGPKIDRISMLTSIVTAFEAINIT